MPLSNAERQRRYRERRKAQTPVVCYRRPVDRRSRLEHWRDTVETLRALQEEYQIWFYISTTPVTCSASDSANNTGTCSFDERPLNRDSTSSLDGA